MWERAGFFDSVLMPWVLIPHIQCNYSWDENEKLVKNLVWVDKSESIPGEKIRQRLLTRLTWIMFLVILCLIYIKLLQPQPNLAKCGTLGIANVTWKRLSCVRERLEQRFSNIFSQSLYEKQFGLKYWRLNSLAADLKIVLCQYKFYWCF